MNLDELKQWSGWISDGGSASSRQALCVLAIVEGASPLPDVAGMKALALRNQALEQRGRLEVVAVQPL
jgi:hypothetical protein